MRIINASYDILRFNKEEDVKAIANGYCICYGTTLPDTYEKQCELIRKRRDDGRYPFEHGSPLEHSIMTVVFTINRGISHELVRHRHCAYSQQSTRYCNYSNNRFGNEITFIEDSASFESAVNDIWKNGLYNAEKEYFDRLNVGQIPEQARGCLPNDLATILQVSTNFREWRNIFMLRCDSHAHYQMREIMKPLLEEMKQELPCIFDDISC